MAIKTLSIDLAEPGNKWKTTVLVHPGAIIIGLNASSSVLFAIDEAELGARAIEIPVARMDENGGELIDTEVLAWKPLGFSEGQFWFIDAAQLYPGTDSKP